MKEIIAGIVGVFLALLLLPVVMLVIERAGNLYIKYVAWMIGY